MALDAATINGLAAHFMAAAGGSAKWETALEQAAKTIGARGAVLVPNEERTASSGHGDGHADAPMTCLAHCLERYDPGKSEAALLEEPAALEQACFLPVRFAPFPFYSELSKPTGHSWSAGLEFFVGRESWRLMFQRAIAEGPFPKAKQRALLPLAAKLSVAAEMAKDLSDAYLGGMCDASDLLGRGCVILNRRSGVIRWNESAAKFLCDGLAVVDGVLQAEEEDANQRLARSLIALRAEETQPRGFEPVAIPRPNKAPLILRAQRLEDRTRHIFSNASALIIITDPDQLDRGQSPVFQRHYKLSAAELRLVQRLGGGGSLASVAAQLGVKHDTARTQLKVIFKKTGTRRQSELIALFAQIGGAL